MWANDGRIKYTTTKGGHRRYFISESVEDTTESTTQKTNIIYARVSSSKQKDDLIRQAEYLKHKYPDHNLITDTASGINYKRPGFKRVLEGVFKGTIGQVVVAHKDRFTRFGYDLFEWIFSCHGAELICDQESRNEEGGELADDLMAIITVFTARYHGKRKYKNAHKLL